MADAAPKSVVLPLFIAVLLVPVVLGSSLTIFNDGDVSWHIATGLWIIDHRAIPNVDPFSFTWLGKPWVPMEWLADVIYASTYRIAGYSGVSATVTLALIGLHAIVFFNATRCGMSAVKALTMLLATDVALIPMMLARPHVLTWPILALWVTLLSRAGSQDQAPSIWWALLIMLWANLHASFVMGLAIGAVFGLEAIINSKNRKRAFRQWAIFGLACIVAFCINPNGVHALLYPLSFKDLQLVPLIDEWRPSSPRVTPHFFVVLVLALVLIVWTRPRLSWVRWLLLGGLLGLALLQVRHQAMFAIVAAVILPAGFAQNRPAVQRVAPRLAWTLAISAAALVILRFLMPLYAPDNPANPWKLIATVPPELRSQPVLNGYSMGGPLILSGIKPYVDGRSDMYGDELVLGFWRMSRGDRAAFDDAVNRWNIRWAIVPNDSKGMIRLLDTTPGWRRIRHDPVGSVYARNP